MADINQIITLGIGTPSDIEHFLLLGLSIPVVGVIYVTLDERDFGSADLYERDITTLTLQERPD